MEKKSIISLNNKDMEYKSSDIQYSSLYNIRNWNTLRVSLDEKISDLEFNINLNLKKVGLFFYYRKTKISKNIIKCTQNDYYTLKILNNFNIESVDQHIQKLNESEMYSVISYNSLDNSIYISCSNIIGNTSSFYANALSIITGDLLKCNYNKSGINDIFDSIPFYYKNIKSSHFKRYINSESDFTCYSTKWSNEKICEMAKKYETTDFNFKYYILLTFMNTFSLSCLLLNPTKKRNGFNGNSFLPIIFTKQTNCKNIFINNEKNKLFKTFTDLTFDNEDINYKHLLGQFDMIIDCSNILNDQPTLGNNINISNLDIYGIPRYDIPIYITLIEIDNISHVNIIIKNKKIAQYFDNNTISYDSSSLCNLKYFRSNWNKCTFK